MKERLLSKSKIKWMALRLALLSLVYVSLFFSQSFMVYAYEGVPNKVRIGLLFNDSQTGQYSSVSSFTVDAQNGLQFGYSSGDRFTCLIKESSGNAVTIRKDAFFLKGSSGLTEYNPSSGKTPSGELIGAYHIKIGEDYKDYDALYTSLTEIRQKGVDAYPVYADSWQIWTGFYVDENDAQKAIIDNIDPVLNTGEYSVVDPSMSRITVLSKDEKVMLMFDSIYYAFQVQPENKDENCVLRINGDDKKRYRGAFEILRLSGSDMTVINVINIEEYLYGVVPYEIQASSHPEALKSQAVAARTYTVNNLNKYKRLQFDLCPTVYSQVYKGFDGEAASTNKAVDDTKGKIVTYNGKPASVFYFSSSGGRTEDVKNVWGSEGYPYLLSVEDKYESGDSWHYNWEVSFTAQKIKQIMVDRGFKLGDIQGIYITKRSEAGRATEVIVKGSQGEKVYTNGSTRNFLSLDSQWYDITTDADIFVKGNDDESTKTQLGGTKVMTASGLQTISSSSGKLNVVNSAGMKVVPLIPTNYTFKGKGWGHAVGMSQEGAKGMAKAGFTYEEILSHYFPGTKVE
ncbi:SpoIID/LytB domain-containing protein [Acetivibrio mesophilus]|uniref:SpoIID/LytB domain-containing protein n=1 Tax=Acetivibrio mesophilus TaxID=2487273 RepID=A0A4Q0I631_9FIRM|nr:SpoIID/LytB domain-containing protein [Acetivibrio mesophilus]ODM25192.1 stage II sporulation protein SpoIID [Clostridium sp. Bc-iso-3]RXE59791.1 SpoIID/LytB domain-containing protein [Acetivibrio mesophilus]HHV29288.1 SpoIID/LytB domain-containing protein [Clostridium sp.]